MTFIKGQLLTAASLNQIRTTINNVLGIGSGDSGYGQDVSLPNAIPVGQVVTAALFDSLRADMARCYIHQQGVAPSDVDAAAGTLNPPNLQDVAPGDLISANLLNQYLNFSNSVSTNRLTVAESTQITDLATPINLYASNNTLTSAWNGIRIFDFTLSWAGYTTPGGVSITAANHRRVFFNAGGEITLRATRSGGSSTSKNTSWTNLLTNAGTFRFNRTTLGTLTGSFSEIYATTVGSGVYAENRYAIYALAPNTSSVRFRMVFNDLDTGDRPVPSPPPPYGPLVDENVDGTLTSIVGCRTADDTNAVNIPMTRGSTFTTTTNSNFTSSATEI